MNVRERRPVRRTALGIALACVALPTAALVAPPASASAVNPAQLSYQIVTRTSTGISVVSEPSGAETRVSTPQWADGSLAIDPANHRGWEGHTNSPNPQGGLPVLQSEIVPINFDSGTSGAPITVPCSGPTSLVASPDATEVAMFCVGDQQVKVLKTSDWSVVSSTPFTWSQNTIYMPVIYFSADATRLFVSTTDGLWTIYNGTASHMSNWVNDWAGENLELQQLADGTYLTVKAAAGVGDTTYTLQRYDCAATCNIIGNPVVIHGGFAQAIPAITSSSPETIAVDPTGDVFVWGTPTAIYEFSPAGALLKTLQVPGNETATRQELALDPSGQKLIFGGTDAAGAYTGMIDIASGAVTRLSSGTFGAIYTLPVTAPTANFTWSGGIAGQPTTFTANATTAPGDPAVLYCWQWGDGSADTCTGDPTTTHTYAYHGSVPYTPHLTVTDALGQAGPGTGWWNGSYWVTKGSTTAVMWHDVYISDQINLQFQFADTVEPGDPLPDFHPGDVVSARAYIGPVFSFNQNPPKIQFTMDGAPLGAPVQSTTWNPQSYMAQINNVDVGTIGQHVFGAYYAGDDTVVPALKPVHSNTFDVNVVPFPSAVTGVPTTTHVAHGGALTVNAAISSPCTGGTYSLALDGAVRPEAPTITSDHTSSFSIAGLADGAYQVRVVWEPDATSTCAASASAPVKVTVGTAPGAASISSVKPVPSGLDVRCRLPKEPVSNLVFQAVPLDKAIAKTVTVTRSGACAATIKGLVKGEAYRVVVTARNVVGSGPSSSTLAVAAVSKGVSLFALPAHAGKPTVYFGYTVVNGRPVHRGKVEISKKAGSWKKVTTLRTSATGRFHGQLRLRSTTHLRARTVIGGRTYVASVTARVTR